MRTIRFADGLPMYQGGRRFHAIAREETPSRPSEGTSQMDAPDQKRGHVTNTVQLDRNTANMGRFMTPYRQLLQVRKLLWEGKSISRADGTGREIEKLRSINNKVAAYKFASNHSVDHVAYKVYGDVRAVEPDRLPPQFVLKPVIGHSSACVFILSRLSGGGYRCDMTKQIFKDFAAVVSAFELEAAAKREHNVRGAEVLIEETVPDGQGFSVPLDYKVYAFLTGAPILMQRYAPRHLHPKDWSFAFYDPQGNDLGQIRSNSPRSPLIELKPPNNLSELFSVATRLVEAASVSFVRVDLYSTNVGVKFGEFTPVPNDAKEFFTDEYEKILGRHWSDSLEALRISYRV